MDKAYVYTCFSLTRSFSTTQFLCLCVGLSFSLFYRLIYTSFYCFGHSTAVKLEYQLGSLILSNKPSLRTILKPILSVFWRTTMLQEHKHANACCQAVVKRQSQKHTLHPTPHTLTHAQTQTHLCTYTYTHTQTNVWIHGPYTVGFDVENPSWYDERNSLLVTLTSKWLSAPQTCVPWT